MKGNNSDAAETTRQIKVLRPWVRLTAGTSVLLLGCAAYSYIVPPRVHSVQFDIKKIEKLSSGRTDNQCSDQGHA